MTPAEMRAEILRLSGAYARSVHAGHRPKAGLPADELPPFVPGETVIPYAGRVFGESEVCAAVGSALDFWLTLGAEGEAFEKTLAARIGARHTVLVNSGSSANLLAFSALTSQKLGARRIQPGDEVITVAAGFPTTVAPIIQNGAVPVFADNDVQTLNARMEAVEAAYVPGKTKAVFMAHTLGNPFDLEAVGRFCAEKGLWLVEDNCDALGARYGGKLTGGFGDLSTQSFYPPHHITLGEGGAVNVVRPGPLKSIVESLRDWGRDCWCPSGKDNTCNRRFGWQLGELPEGYDHKYIYGHLGYNLKPLDLQAAIGRQQLERLDGFVKARRDNWEHLRRGLAGCEEFFGFQLPTHARGWTPDGFEWDASGREVEPSWFGFLLMVRPGAPFTRRELAVELDGAKIGNRMLFGGNLTRQPAFVALAKDRPGSWRAAGALTGADEIMKNALFVGVYPGLSAAMLDYMIERIAGFARRRAGGG